MNVLQILLCLLPRKGKNHFMAHFGMSIKQQHSCCVGRVTDVPFSEKWNNEPNLAETALLMSDSTPRIWIYSEASRDQVLSCLLQ